MIITKNRWNLLVPPVVLLAVPLLHALSMAMQTFSNTLHSDHLFGPHMSPTSGAFPRLLWHAILLSEITTPKDLFAHNNTLLGTEFK